MKKPLNKAFTLVELLIVISIVSLLSTIVMYSVSEAQIKAQDTHKKEEVRQVKNALELSKSSSQFAPGSSSLTAKRVYNENSQGYQDAMSELVADGSISEIPRSPNGRDYFYTVDESGKNGVFGTILRSDDEIEDSNGCYFSDDNYGCSTEGATSSYIHSYTRDSLVEESDDCSSGSCGSVEVSEGGDDSGPVLEWSGHMGRSTYDGARTRCGYLIMNGKDDWRLPYISQIQLLFSENPANFENPGTYVSAQTRYDSDYNARVVDYFRTADGQTSYSCYQDLCDGNTVLPFFDYGCVRY